MDRLAAQVRLPAFPPFHYCRTSSDYPDSQPKDEGTVITGYRNRASAPLFLKGQFLGKSSQAVLVKSILEWKPDDQSRGDADEPGPERRERMWDVLVQRLGKFQVQAWEEGTVSPPAMQPSNCSFPDPDLMSALIDLYFEYVNLFNPLLHRPTFDRLLHDNMHFKDVSLAEVVLLVCALGARFSDDQRVFLDGSTLSAGCMWFKQAQEIEDRILAPASLYHIQASFLRAEFLRGANPSQRAWAVLGIGLRRAQDVGAHRWQTFGAEKSAERELWTRAWWCLVVLDRVASAILGRPCVTDGWDFDVGLPTDCDDEFWDHPDPDKRWKQPDGIPSKISFFISHINQTTILARAQRTLYSIDCTRRTYMLEIFPDFDRRVVTVLDSALNQWISDIPEHLQNPRSQTNPMFHRQSIVLHAELYFLQNLMHRPFLMSPDQNTPMTSSSIAICTNAARACSRLLDTQDKSCLHAVYRIHWPIFISAVMLLLRVWTGKRLGLQGFHAEMENVKKCMTMLSYSERCWQSSGQLVDILNSLVDASDLVLPGSDQASKSPQSASNLCAQQQQQLQAQPLDGGLAVFTEDLANVPVYSSFPPHPGSESQTQSVPSYSSNNHAFTHEPLGPFEHSTQMSGDRLAQPSSGQQNPFPHPHGYGLPLNAHDLDPLAELDSSLMIPDMFDAETLAILNSTPFTYFGDWGTFVDNVNEVQMSSNMGSMRMA